MTQKLFRISKISTFESNSQPKDDASLHVKSCSEYQRYQLLRAIHNKASAYLLKEYVVPNIKDINFWEQFTTTTQIEIKFSVLFRISKISTFESNSQLFLFVILSFLCCSEYQRYQLLRAIHNHEDWLEPYEEVVPNIKDINFWEQFTTCLLKSLNVCRLFRISKISTFESNSQLA